MFMTIFLFLSPSFSEILLVLLAVLLMFGSDKLPELARGVGKGVRQFKNATGEIQREIKSGMTEVKEVKKKVEDDINSKVKDI